MDDSRVGKSIKLARIQKGMTQTELANRLGLALSTIQKYENGRIQNMKQTTILKLSKILELSTSELMGWEEPTPDLSTIPNIIHIKKQSFPLLGNIAAGQPITAEENIECYIEAVGGIKADYALHVKGDSMIGARIYDGDIVFIHTQATVDNGQIAAGLIDDEATLKRVYQTGDHITLVAENPAYQPMIYTPGSGKEIRILGKAVAFQSIVK